MKKIFFGMAFLLFIQGLRFSIISQGPSSSQETPEDRKLQSTAFFDDAFQPSNIQISIGIIKDMIIDEHKNIKLCIESEFQLDSRKVPDFSSILRGCVGDNYSIVLKFYDNINQYIRELTKDNIKSRIRTDYCVQNFIPCLEFFKIIGMLIDMDYDLMKSVDMNQNELNRKIGEPVMNELINLTHQELDDYVALRTYLLKERKFLNEFFRQKYQDYIAKYGSLSGNQEPPAL